MLCWAASRAAGARNAAIFVHPHSRGRWLRWMCRGISHLTEQKQQRPPGRGDERVSAANTFIDPIRHRPNLKILSESLLDRITFSNNRAAGVLLADKRHILATHEVVLSAGAILSPAILQRSGIGPSQLLHRHGITSVLDLPVGLSACDHPCVPIVAKPRPGSYHKDDYSLQCQARWSSSLRPGAIDHQLVCFSNLFAEVPDPSSPAAESCRRGKWPCRRHRLQP